MRPVAASTNAPEQIDVKFGRVCVQSLQPGELYKARSRIEQGVGRLRRFKRVALRCEKTARNFRSIVSFAAGLCLIKFVHRDPKTPETLKKMPK
jgi:transposase